MTARKPRLGVSSCLLGEAVRWDGGHRRDAFVVDVLGEHVEWVPVCPELELGLGVPREPIRLVGDPRSPRLLGERSGRDHTEAMRRFAEARVRALEALGLAGYVTKRDSPSCGLAGVAVFPGRGGAAPRRAGVGMFARSLVERMPLLPVEDEGRLQDGAAREAFVERVFAHVRWRGLVARPVGRAELLRFHSAHALALAAHDPGACRRLGALAATPARGPFARVVEAYGRGFMAALRTPATRARHAQVLRHALGLLRPVLAAPDRVELAEAVRGYASALVPLVVPQTLLRHHVHRHGVPALEGQTYLEPDPRELALRNHA